MDSIQSFLRVADKYCAARGISETRLSTIILNGGGRIPALRAGTSDVGTRTLAKAMQWLSDNWLDEAAWPEDVPRPEPSALQKSDEPPSETEAA